MDQFHAAQVDQFQSGRITTLVERFKAEMKYAVGDPRGIRALFLEMIASVFGELKRVAAERMVPARWT